MICKWYKCDNELTGRQRGYCSDKCRMAHKRANRTLEPQFTNSNKPEQTKPEQTKPEQLPEDMFTAQIPWAQIHALPMGVVRSTCRPDGPVSWGGNWWDQPEYAQAIEQLLTNDPQDLTDQGVLVPVWVYQYSYEPAQAASVNEQPAEARI